MSSRAIYTADSPTRENSSVAFPGKLAEFWESVRTSFSGIWKTAVAKVIPVAEELLRLSSWIINFRN